MVDLTELALQAIGVFADHCGTVLGTLVQARRQVWFAQSSLPVVCRNNLRRLPLVPGRVLDQLDRKLGTNACWCLKLVRVMWGQPQDLGPLRQPLVSIITILV